MKYTVLTLTPPYGTLMMLPALHVDLGKRIETRGWRTNYRGLLLIHQGRNLAPVGGMEGLLRLCSSQPFFDSLMHIVPGYDRSCDKETIAQALPMGKIIGAVELTDCRTTAGRHGEHGTASKYADWVHDLSKRERAFGDYTQGRWAWFCSNARPLAEPIAVRGYPGLWTWNGELGLCLAAT